MPCDSVIMNRVAWTVNTDLDLLMNALRSAGYYVDRYNDTVSFYKTTTQRGSFARGEFRVPEGADVDAIKRAYSVETVKATAKKMGWQYKQDAKGKIQIRRRS